MNTKKLNWTPLEAMEQAIAALPDASFAAKYNIDPAFIHRLDAVIRDAKEGKASDKSMLDTLRQAWAILPQAWKEHKKLSPELMAGIVSTISTLQMSVDKTLEFTATNGSQFVARVVLKGDKYGRHFDIEHDMDEPMIEFYDAQSMHTQYGQFVTRYYMYSLAEINQESGTPPLSVTLASNVDLYGDFQEWQVDRENINRVTAWAKNIIDKDQDQYLVETQNSGLFVTVTRLADGATLFMQDESAAKFLLEIDIDDTEKRNWAISQYDDLFLPDETDETKPSGRRSGRMDI